jgi:hypothetical protein
MIAFDVCCVPGRSSTIENSIIEIIFAVGHIAIGHGNHPSLPELGYFLWRQIMPGNRGGPWILFTDSPILVFATGHYLREIGRDFPVLPAGNCNVWLKGGLQTLTIPVKRSSARPR